MPKPLLLAALFAEAVFVLLPDFGFAKENVLASSLLLSQGIGAAVQIEGWMYWTVTAVKVAAIALLLASRLRVGRVLFIAYLSCSILASAVGGLLITAPSVGVVGLIVGLLDGAVLYACFATADNSRATPEGASR